MHRKMKNSPEIVSSASLTFSEFFGNVNKHADMGYLVDIMLLDISKVFDKDPQQRLPSKPSNHGIRRKVLLWINK